MEDTRNKCFEPTADMTAVEACVKTLLGAGFCPEWKACDE